MIMIIEKKTLWSCPKESFEVEAKQTIMFKEVTKLFSNAIMVKLISLFYCRSAADGFEMDEDLFLE